MNRLLQRSTRAPMQQTGVLASTSPDMSRLPLAASFVPFQTLTTVYEPMQALAQGTLFPDLDKPFQGRTITSEGRQR